MKTLEKIATNTHCNEDIKKAVDNLIRVVQNSATSEGETIVAGCNSISASNSISSSSGNSISSVRERIQSMFQASSRHFNCLKPNERLLASRMETLLFEL